MSPLWLACNKNHLKVVKELIKYGADVNTISGTQSSALRSTCFSGYIDIVKYLVKKGADIHQRNKLGSTCLMNTVRNVDLCEFIINRGANIDMQDNYGRTALHYAVKEGKLEVVKLFLQYGANASIRDKYDQDALMLACMEPQEEIAKYLIESGCYSPDQQINAYFLLGAACVQQNNTSGARKYFKQAIDTKQKVDSLNIQTIQNATGLHRFNSTRLGTLQTVDLLDEFDAMCASKDHVHIMAIMACERILGPYHCDTIDCVKYVAACHADDGNFEKCALLLIYALHLQCNGPIPDNVTDYPLYTLNFWRELFCSIHFYERNNTKAKMLLCNGTIQVLTLADTIFKRVAELSGEGEM